MRKLYTIFYCLTDGHGYDAPHAFKDRVLARHAEEARMKSYERVQAALVREGLYDDENDWLIVVATVRGRHSCDED